MALIDDMAKVLVELYRLVVIEAGDVLRCYDKMKQQDAEEAQLTEEDWEDYADEGEWVRLEDWTPEFGR